MADSLTPLKMCFLAQKMVITAQQKIVKEIMVSNQSIVVRHLIALLEALRIVLNVQKILVMNVSGDIKTPSSKQNNATLKIQEVLREQFNYKFLNAFQRVSMQPQFQFSPLVVSSALSVLNFLYRNSAARELSWSIWLFQQLRQRILLELSISIATHV